MKEHDLAIPFDVNAIHENPLKKLIRKTNILIKAGILRTFEILISAVGVISLLPNKIICFILWIMYYQSLFIFGCKDNYFSFLLDKIMLIFFKKIDIYFY